MKSTFFRLPFFPSLSQEPHPMQINPSIFKAYDIRGVVPSTIHEEMAEALGKAFGMAALAEGEKAVAVGRDGRLSGPSLSAALMRGLAATGIDVIDVGMVTTPMLYFRRQHPGRFGHPGHGQPQPQGLQRLQDGAGRARDLRRGNPGAAPRHRRRQMGAACEKRAPSARSTWARPTATASSPASSWSAR
jgi:hypothetical protein